MKIGVETSVLIRKQKTGVENYTLNILREVVKQMPNDQFYMTYISFITKKSADLGVRGPNVFQRKINLLPGRLYHLFVRKLVGIPYDFLALLKPDIFFFPNFIRWPLAWTKKSVIVVYDLSFLKASEYATKSFREYMTKIVPKSIRQASQVVAISESTKREIINEYGTDPNKITVIYPAVDHEFFRPASSNEVEDVKQKFQIEGPYILSVGTQEPRKNLLGLLKAYAKLDEKILSSHTLVLTGGKGWLDQELNSLYDNLIKNYSIIRTGYVDEKDLPALFTGASVFAYPAFYEGFGMPPLEAMACGTPVITSNNTSLPEVVGDAGLMVGAHNIDELTAALTRVLSDEKLAQKMSKAGLEQSKKFVWSHEAAKLVKVFDGLGKSK